MDFGSLKAFLKTARGVRAESGKSIFSQFKNIRRLRNYPNCLSRDEYYNMKLYTRDADEQNEFLGAALEGSINYILSSPFWFSSIRDKLSFHNILKNSGIATPEIIAIYGTEGQIGPIRSVATPAALEGLLLDLETPYFGKPSVADVGVGGIRVEKIDRDKKILLMANGEAVPVSEMVERISQLQYGNFLFQEVLHNAPEIVDMLGSGLSSVRICMMKTAGGSKVYRAIMRVCMGRNYSDNWDRGTSGNALAFLDIETGAIRYLAHGPFPDISFTDIHPETGKQLAGQVLPHWQEAISLCQKASHIFTGIHMMHWDVAITANGPSLIEVNEDGSLMLLQEIGRKGFYTSEFKAFFAEFGHDLEKPETQDLLKVTGKLVERLYGMDNALAGRGTLYNMTTSMK